MTQCHRIHRSWEGMWALTCCSKSLCRAISFLGGGSLQGWDQYLCILQPHTDGKGLLCLQQLPCSAGGCMWATCTEYEWFQYVGTVQTSVCCSVEGSPFPSKLTQGHALQSWIAAWAIAYRKFKAKIRTYASTSSTAFLLVPESRLSQRLVATSELWVV